MQNIYKDIIKATSILITQIFSVINFHQILYSTYFSSGPFVASTIIFSILFILIYASKMFFLIKELIATKNFQNSKNQSLVNNSKKQ